MRNWLTQMDQFFQSFVPDAFVIAVGLTVCVLSLAVFGTDSPSDQVLAFWQEGFWSLLSFTLQMALVLLLGYSLAISQPAKLFMTWLCRPVKAPGPAVIWVTLLSAVASLFNWGFGLIFGAFIALELARKVPKASYRVLIASSFSGFLLWHGGVSGSIPLSVATPENFALPWAGRLIPITETLFSPFNLTAIATMLIALPLVNWLFLRWTPEDEHSPRKLLAKDGTSDSRKTRNRPISLWAPKASFLCLVALGSVFVTWQSGSLSWNLNSMNFFLYFLALAAHGTSHQFLNSLKSGSEKIIPIVAQYPLYAGIMFVMNKTGLAASFSLLLTENANADSYAVLTFLSAGLLNVFVPSGGGQWAVQAPVVLPSAAQLGISPALAVMAVAWGDAWTNLIQPFWALPLLAIAGLKPKHIFLQLFLLLFVTGGLLSLLLLAFS